MGKFRWAWALAVVAVISAAMLSLRSARKRSEAPATSADATVPSSVAAEKKSAPVAANPVSRASRPVTKAASASESDLPTADTDSGENVVFDDDDSSEDERHAADREGVMLGVRTVLPKMKECYENALKKDPKLGGSVVLELTLRPQNGKGIVSSAEVAMGDDGGTLNSPLLEQCLLNAVASAAFPPPSSEELFITYPFKLVPGSESDDSDSESDGEPDEPDQDGTPSSSLHAIRASRG
jgi:hypothetical protein